MIVFTLLLWKFYVKTWRTIGLFCENFHVARDTRPCFYLVWQLYYLLYYTTEVHQWFLGFQNLQNLALKALFKCNKGKVRKHLMQKKLNVAWWPKKLRSTVWKILPIFNPSLIPKMASNHHQISCRQDKFKLKLGIILDVNDNDWSLFSLIERDLAF